MPSIRPDPNILKKHPGAITQQQIDEKGRFIGALLGAAAGEALGAPHEGKPADQVGTPREITGGGIGAATALAYLVGGGKDAGEAVERASGAAGAVSDDVLSAIERGASKKPVDLHVDGDARGYVLHTVELAFSALASAASLEEGIVS